MLWDSIVEETSAEIAMECASCQMPRDLDTRHHQHHHHHLNLDASMHDMAVDELSFYGNEHDDCDDDDSNSASPSHGMRHPFVDLPEHMGLLLPECSPRRFHIVERAGAQKLRQQLVTAISTTTTRQQKLLQSANGASTASTNTPGKELRIFHSLSSGSMESSMDDDYLELFEMESLEQQIGLGSSAQLKFPSDLNSLISGKIKSASSPQQQQLQQTPEMRRPPARRCLSMTENYQQPQPKTPEIMKSVHKTAPISTTPLSRLTAGVDNCCFKRPDPPSTTSSPVQIKRYRGDEKENLNDSLTMVLTRTSAGGGGHESGGVKVHSHHIPLRKCVSMNDAEIMSALARSENKDEADLIGDFSKPFALPLMEGRHRDLKSISCETMARLLCGEFDDQVASYRIIDCRYPYEYEGGHIRGAQNLYTQEQIIEEFLTQPKTEQHRAGGGGGSGGGCKRHIIIFHCEFSSERGPKLSRFLRNNDRARNSYPALDYPEIYLLHNGYKEFYETHAELCNPESYRPMLEPSYSNAYRHFRAKSKSWNGDGLGGATSRMKKSRSRLML